MNDKIRESASGKAKPGRSQWSPSEQQKQRAEKVLFQFLQATDGARYRDAYGIFTPGMKSMMPFERFASHEQTFRAASGGDPVRTDIHATWYNDPPKAAAPGVYAAFDIKCRFQNINLCTEVVILHEQENGEFLVMRHERNYVDKDTESELRERQRQRKNP